MFSFIGESSVLSVRIDHGKVWLDQHRLDLPAGDVPNGPAWRSSAGTTSTVVDNARGAIVGEGSVLRRHAGLRRVDLEVGAKRNRIEIDSSPPIEASIFLAP